MTDPVPSRTYLRRFRLMLWLLVGLALAGLAALMFIPRTSAGVTEPQTTAAQPKLGGPFTLTDGKGQRFSSAKLHGEPYAIFFGFTRCGDVCPTTLGRLAKLRNQLGDADAFNIVFVTIDPAYDGPKQVGQYAELFNTPIIGLTGSQAEIDQVKKQYGIFAQPSAHPMPGKEMEHSTPVLLFDGKGSHKGNISADDSDEAALAKLRQLTA